jgi:SAM-dependent methyltransferase
MSHKEQRDFVKRVLNKFGPSVEGKCYDFGSLDINGSVRKDMESLGLEYTGIDIGEGANVDVVCLAHEFKPEYKAGVVVSCEMLEHDRFWQLSLQNMYDVLEDGGLMIISCATHGRPEHGTARTSPRDSPFTVKEDEWANYYRNLGQEDFEVVFKEGMFSEYEYSRNTRRHDIYFWGIKA